MITNLTFAIRVIRIAGVCSSWAGDSLGPLPPEVPADPATVRRFCDDILERIEAIEAELAPEGKR